MTSVENNKTATPIPNNKINSRIGRRIKQQSQMQNEHLCALFTFLFKKFSECKISECKTGNRSVSPIPGCLPTCLVTPMLKMSCLADRILSITKEKKSIRPPNGAAKVTTVSFFLGHKLIILDDANTHTQTPTPLPLTLSHTSTGTWRHFPASSIALFASRLVSTWHRRTRKHHLHTHVHPRVRPMPRNRAPTTIDKNAKSHLISSVPPELPLLFAWKHMCAPQLRVCICMYMLAKQEVRQCIASDECK